MKRGETSKIENRELKEGKKHKMKELYKCWTIFLLTTVALSGGAGG
jgi:hypothetical protein